MIAGALASPPPHGISAAARGELERLEREATDLLRVVLDTLGAGWR